ncbi:hypothetical protein CVV38_00215 [Candidatus Peregrinibacteria bacterium HGW-Peregrinibacteria-1]|jgi:adenylate kinase|nr:MAG: hypothetical protein CVV38_00215 [Candidatus Peregrinibacteria bacterium HGW-Peregrinibacteria-1]
MDLILFGMQGAGKGTLAKGIADRYDFEIFETGSELRKLSNQDSPLGEKIRSILEAGNLVSNDIVMEIVTNFVENLPAGKKILFDGIPRGVEQAQTLNALIARHNRVALPIFIEISEETALIRLTTRKICSDCKTVYPRNYTKTDCEKCGGKLTTRSDDTPEAIKKRLENFKESTIPAIEIYKDNILVIDGEPDIQTVENNAIEKLDRILK